jgi:hypothetical protein
MHFDLILSFNEMTKFWQSAGKPRKIAGFVGCTLGGRFIETVSRYKQSVG